MVHLGSEVAMWEPLWANESQYPHQGSSKGRQEGAKRHVICCRLDLLAWLRNRCVGHVQWKSKFSHRIMMPEASTAASVHHEPLVVCLEGRWD